MSIFHHFLYKINLWRAFKSHKNLVQKVQELPKCWSSDANKGDLYQQGTFTWQGHTVITHDTPFAYPPQTPDAWIQHAHSFEWMLHIRSSVEFKKCMSWIMQWHTTYKMDFSAWHTDITAKRLCTWLSHYESLVMGISHTDRQHFHHIIAIHYQYLQYVSNASMFHPPQTHIQQLQNLRAIICTGLSIGDEDLPISQLLKKFTTILETIIDEDGFVRGHLPTHLEVLKICVYVRASLHKMQADVPEILDSYVDKMWQVVRFFYNVNKDFSHMAGTSALNYAYHMIENSFKKERHIVPALYHSGYFMYKTPALNVYLDAQTRMGHSTDNGGILGITLYYKGHPICVACGYTQSMGIKCQYSAAHNVLVINNTNTIPIHKLQHKNFRKKDYTPHVINTKSQDIGDWKVLKTAHTAYEKVFGVKVERHIGMHTNGHIMCGRDSVGI